MWLCKGHYYSGSLSFYNFPYAFGLLFGLGVFQLALPCLLVVGLTAVLPAPEIALLGLLEVLFGVLWAWVGAGEVPGPATLSGGLLVLGALVGNELLALAGRHRTGPAR